MPPKRSKKVAEANKGKAKQVIEDSPSPSPSPSPTASPTEEESGEEANKSGESKANEAERDLQSNGRQLRRNVFEARTKALGRLPKDGSKGDKKRKVLFDRATDLIQSGCLKSNPCSNCKAANKECFVADDNFKKDGASDKCAFCVWGATTCSVSLFRALEPIDS